MLNKGFNLKKGVLFTKRGFALKKIMNNVSELKFESENSTLLEQQKLLEERIAGFLDAGSITQEEVNEIEQECCDLYSKSVKEFVLPN